tara:strand:- start:185 stop:859 length:675 start_codon:yes stop_codon:yes gene_type:complete
LTFDIFGTVLNLGDSLVPPLDNLLISCGVSHVTGEYLWQQWRQRQRIEQYQDNLLMLKHKGYLDTNRRALMYTLRRLKIPFGKADLDIVMEAYKTLVPFKDAIDGLAKLGNKYELVMLSNGEHWYLEHLAKTRILLDFDEIISVESVGQFKPHPSVYRFASQKLNREPNQIMMVAAHSFDILGARHSGFRGAYVNRYDLPYDESEFTPDIITPSFKELCETLKV